MFVAMAFTVMAALLGYSAGADAGRSARTFLANAVEPDWPAFKRLRERYQRLITTTLAALR